MSASPYFIKNSLSRLDIDKKGFDQMDKNIISSLIEKFDGGPVGIKNIAVAVGEDPNTIEELYEPYLIKEGYLKRTFRGRQVTNLAYEHFGYTRSTKEKNLFE